MLNDPLAASLSKILNAERKNKKEILLKPISKTIKLVLNILNEHNYLGTFEETEDGRGSFIKVNLLGNINQCGVIKPRFSAKISEFEKWEKRYLPAKDVGIIILSTSQGIITHYSAKEKKIGGKLLAYCF